jgi:hypothetical protein
MGRETMLIRAQMPALCCACRVLRTSLLLSSSHLLHGGEHLSSSSLSRRGERRAGEMLVLLHIYSVYYSNSIVEEDTFLFLHLGSSEKIFVTPG